MDLDEGRTELAKRAALAYSGGLDTSVIVPWLRERYGLEVACVAVDVGQGAGELAGLEEKAGASGAVSCHVIDARAEFLTGYVWPTLRAGAVYGRSYLLGTAMARPLIARKQVEVAREVGAEVLVHGCTGKGNDQLRFELTYAALAPELGVIAPWREWSIRSRTEALRYAAEHGIPVTATVEKPYSRDRNLWHISHEGGDLEDPWWSPPAELYQMTRAPGTTPETPEVVEIAFEQGIPVAVNGESLDPVALLERLNEIGGRHGVGVVDLVEDRVVGMKSRGIYETPGGTLLYAAHSELEQLTLDRRTLAAKDQLADRYADMVYEGRWWSIERLAMDAFVDVTQRAVAGRVRLRLYGGAHAVIARQADRSLYDEGLVTFEADDRYDQADAGAFIRLFGLQSKVTARAHGDWMRLGGDRGGALPDGATGPASPAGLHGPASGPFGEPARSRPAAREGMPLSPIRRNGKSQPRRSTGTAASSGDAGELS